MDAVDGFVVLCIVAAVLVAFGLVYVPIRDAVRRRRVRRERDRPSDGGYRDPATPRLQTRGPSNPFELPRRDAPRVRPVRVEKPGLEITVRVRRTRKDDTYDDSDRRARRRA